MDGATRDGMLELGTLRLAGGGRLPQAQIDYRLHGTLDEAGTNVVVLPHMYSGTSRSMDFLVGPGRALDPARFLIVCPGQLGNGVATSPSTTGLGDGAFPTLAVADDAAAQLRLLEHLGVRGVHLALGYSMGAQQAYALAAAVPGLVQRVGAIAGCAATTTGARAYARLLRDSLDGTDVHAALVRHAHVFAALGLGSAVYRDEAWREAGYASADDMIERLLVADYAAPGRDRDDLQAQLDKWISAATAIEDVVAPVLALALAGDALFPVEDITAEIARARQGELRVVDTPWGHYGGAGLRPSDAAAVEAALVAMVELSPLA